MENAWQSCLLVLVMPWSQVQSPFGTQELSCLRQGIGLNDLLRSFPAPLLWFLWFCIELNSLGLRLKSAWIFHLIDIYNRERSTELHSGIRTKLGTGSRRNCFTWPPQRSEEHAHIPSQTGTSTSGTPLLVQKWFVQVVLSALLSWTPALPQYKLGILQECSWETKLLFRAFLTKVCLHSVLWAMSPPEDCMETSLPCVLPDVMFYLKRNQEAGVHVPRWNRKACRTE